MTGGGASGHTDGLIMYNGALRSPRQGANSGNFSTLANGPTGNPNYSGVSGTQKHFFRKIQNTGSTIRDLKITSTKNTKYNNSSLTSEHKIFNKTTRFISLFGYFSTFCLWKLFLSMAMVYFNSNKQQQYRHFRLRRLLFIVSLLEQLLIANGQYVVVRVQANCGGSC